MKRLGLTAVIGAAVIALAAPLIAQASATDPAGFASAADVRAAVAKMAAGMKPGQHFAWAPLMRAGATIAALEYWTAAGKPAVHPDDAEYTIVVEGAGTLISGGKLIDASVTHPDLVEGSRIEGGTTRTLKVGDVMLIPAGSPHWFDVTDGKLVLLGMKLPRR